jgi:hypothetical protein
MIHFKKKLLGILKAGSTSSAQIQTAAVAVWRTCATILYIFFIDAFKQALGLGKFSNKKIY